MPCDWYWPTIGDIHDYDMVSSVYCLSLVWTRGVERVTIWSWAVHSTRVYILLPAPHQHSLPASHRSTISSLRPSQSSVTQLNSNQRLPWNPWYFITIFILRDNRYSKQNNPIIVMLTMQLRNKKHPSDFYIIYIVLLQHDHYIHISVSLSWLQRRLEEKYRSW